MAKLINLNRMRKRRDKQDASKTAEMNRAKFGRPKAERDRTSVEMVKATKALDQHKLSKEDTT